MWLLGLCNISPRERDLFGGRGALPSLLDPARDQRRVRARLDAQLGDLQVDQRVNVMLMKAQGEACLLGQQVGTTSCDLSQLGKCRGLLSASQRLGARMASGDRCYPRCCQA